ncbi:hypothetical protein EKO23_18095 [Nocardioides guangzhouensis]|uniref:Uncharacterized protein n=1 Tax=Nocardioides guangzhouensis TaxID=2497878 RepID=A0A4Q4Z9D2_9ACTN|nr:hypothetical protein [Nocardioides guangzhouensis]RYP83811.1 hypothetical protein EKO23_18095 [Nocardioides guangzhouensis]
MTPLQRIAMGLVVVVLDTVGGYDLLPDPLGWLLVLWGVAALPGTERGAPRAAAVVAGLVSVAGYPPAVHDRVADAEPALRWALDLPDLVFVLVLARGLHRLARPTDPRTAGRMRGIATASAALAVAPVLLFAGGADELLPWATLAVQLLWLWLVWNLFAAHAQNWVSPGADPSVRPGSGPETR